MSKSDQPSDAAVQFPAVTILGSRVHLPSLEQAADTIREWIHRRPGRCRHVVATGFHGLWEAHRDPGLHYMLNSADLWVPDGIAPVWLARWRGFPRAQRVPGPDLMCELLRRGNRIGLRSFFLGDTDDTLAAVAGRICCELPGNRVVGTRSPPFRELTHDDNQRLVDEINRAAPDILWVGLGAPRQERWIAQHRNQLNAGVAIGVGAAFRFFCGRTVRAPAWVGDAGLEWAFRLWQQPRKCWRRCFVDGPAFLFHVALEAARNRTRGTAQPASAPTLAPHPRPARNPAMNEPRPHGSGRDAAVPAEVFSAD